MCFFDSDVCIEIMRGHLPRAQEIMRKSSPDLFGVPAIVEAELLYGAENSNNPEEGRYFVESLLSPLHIIPFDSRCAACYARVRADLKRRGCSNRAERSADCRDGPCPWRDARFEQHEGVPAYRGIASGVVGGGRLLRSQ